MNTLVNCSPLHDNAIIIPRLRILFQVSNLFKQTIEFKNIQLLTDNFL